MTNTQPLLSAKYIVNIATKSRRSLDTIIETSKFNDTIKLNAYKELLYDLGKLGRV